MAHTMGLNCGKPLSHTPSLFPVPQVGLCPIVCLYRYVWPHSDTRVLFEFTSFQARKGGFCSPLRSKGPELGVIITTLR